MSDYDKSIHSNPDAQAWAKFFMATVNEQEWCIDDIDESLMTGWFANAMMAMHDHVKREWVGLTDEDIKNAVLDDPIGASALMSLMRDEVMVTQVRQAINRIAQTIEAKLKEKNG